MDHWSLEATHDREVMGLDTKTDFFNVGKKKSPV